MKNIDTVKNIRNTTQTHKIIKTTSDSLFDITKPVKPELLEYTWITIVLLWVGLAIWVKQIWKKKRLSES